MIFPSHSLYSNIVLVIYIYIKWDILRNLDISHIWISFLYSHIRNIIGNNIGILWGPNNILIYFRNCLGNTGII